MLCTHKTTILCQFGLFCHQLTTISPSILIHFWWELYHSHDENSILQSLQGQFKLKGDKIEPPDMYLGAQLGTMEVEGNEGWFMSSEKYVKSTIQNIEETLQKMGQRLPSKCKMPLAYGYHLELKHYSRVEC